MAVVSRIGDIGTGHGSFPDTPIIEASGDVFCNGKGVAREGDALQDHSSPSPSPSHPRHIASCSGNIFVNGKPMARLGDPVDCGGLIAQGSGDTKGN